jgi:hypothetical protein
VEEAEAEEEEEEMPEESPNGVWVVVWVGRGAAEALSSKRCGRKGTTAAAARRRRP